VFIGVRMGSIFELAKEFIQMPPDELEILLESPIHELRVGALSIMGKQAAHKKTTESRKKELYDLYLRRHDRINNWDLVDLAAQHVVGAYLADKPRDRLYTLAKSENMWERRTSMYACVAYIRKGDVDDTLKIAEILVNDPEELIQKAVGTLLRGVDGDNRPKLLDFLDRYAATMPRVMLRYAIEHLSDEQRAHYMSLKHK
jgi:3-methyladenine DNA glycosylase AlkD